jgi:T5SS/PEP-CTERM-associated repeat protein
MNREERSIALAFLLISAIVLTLVPSNHAAAAITGAGDISPGLPPSDPWTVGVLQVGVTSTATLTLSQAGHVTVTNYYIIGANAAATGTVTVRDNGSQFVNQSGADHDPSVIGLSGHGTLHVWDAGYYAQGDAPELIGARTGGRGAVDVNGTGARWQGSENLFVGVWGQGSFTVSNDGDANDVAMFIGGLSESLGRSSSLADSQWIWDYRTPSFASGHEPNGTGTVIVAGSTSVLSSPFLVVGDTSEGTLSVLNGALVQGRSIDDPGEPGDARGLLKGMVGFSPHSQGTIVVDGANSRLGVDRVGSTVALNDPNLLEYGLRVGVWGHGSLTVSNGGSVVLRNLMAGGTDPGLVGRAGANTLEMALDYIDKGGVPPVGYDPGNLDTWVPLAFPYGTTPNGTGTINVTGSGSVLDADLVQIGAMGGTGVVDISAGGRLVSTQGYIGGANPAMLLSLDWTFSPEGGGGDDTLLDVLDAAGLGDLYDPNGHGTVTVRGTNSRWENAGNLYVGYSADAHLVVSNAGRVTDANAFMAYEAGSEAAAVVTGANSLWRSSGNLYVGGGPTSAGGTASLNISTGGVVEAHDAVIWAGSSLGGDGTLRAGSVTNWGTIRPGNSIGTLTVDGDLALEPNSVLEVEVDNSGHSDKLHVTGDVDIVGGTVMPISTETIVGNKQYTIIEANSVTGRFDSVDVNTALLHMAMAYSQEDPAYTPGSVVLKITANSFEGVGRTPNQQQIEGALQDIAEAQGNIMTAMVQQLPTLDAVRTAYDQLAGQSRPPLAPVAMTDATKFIGIISNRLQGARGGMARSLDGLSDTPLLAMAEPDTTIGAGSSSSWDGFLWDLPSDTSQDWGVWGKTYGLSGDRKTDTGTPGYSYSVWGQTFGTDSQMGERFIGGAMGGFSKTRVDYDGLNDEATIDAMHLGLYSNYSGDGWYANSAVLYSILNLDTKRTVDLTGEQHEGSFDGREISGYIEAGVDWQPAMTWLIQPLAGFQVSYLHLDEYAETGLLSALVYGAQDYESYRGSVGAKVSKEVALDLFGGAAIIQGRGRWVHEFGDVLSTVDARFEDVPPIKWQVSDAEVSRDSIMLGAGLGLRLSRGLRGFVDYDTSFNSDKTVNVISGALEYRW